uniref:Uncharacterized protein n=1 Tax=Arundo donax TaxID=35708 RepID=A0A0A9A4E5_ARUDO
MNLLLHALAKLQVVDT